MKIFCSGIGGIGLSAYAALQTSNGHTVSGSDRSLSPITADLQAMGVAVTSLQDGSALPEDADLLVYSEAIPADAPERTKAKKLGIRQISYFAALGELSRGHRVIAICGTHGKSSTTAMTALALVEAGLDPTVVVGTRVSQLGGRNWRKGASDLFVVEACEYKGSFLHLDPSVIVLTNVDWDHVDAYPTFDTYKEAFMKFIARLPEYGTVITHMHDPACAGIIKDHRIIDADALPLPALSIPGMHMRINAALVAALGKELGVADETIAKSLRNFRGTWRRMEVKGETKNGVTVIDDYGHHPSEIAATIAAMREAYPERRLVCVFQPHMHDRTLALYDNFTLCFRGCERVVITDVYEARRETGGARADAEKLTHDIASGSDVEASYGGSLSDTEKLLKSGMLRTGDVLLVMGAGDITNLADCMLD